MRPALRRAFERAAATYDAHAVLQQEVRQRLLEHLEGIRIDPAFVLDLGCATGGSFAELRRRFPAARLAGVDIAESMARKAAARAPWWKRVLGGRTSIVCADAERLPLAPGCAQLVFSNLMLQWCRPEAVFAEVARVLHAGGLFMFSSFGPDTLKELRGAFTAVGAGERVNAFIDMHDLGDALVHAGFADPVMEMEMITLEYSTVEALVRELRHLGSRSRAGAAHSGLFGKARWQALTRDYESRRRDGALPATYEVIYGHAWKVPPRKLADGRQVIDFQRRR
jgi:malonyl-CoA O-methyltransferase